MDKKYIDDNNIKNKYLRGLLTPDEIIQFESYLMDKPTLVEELELDDVFFRVMPRSQKLQVSPSPRIWGFLNIPLRSALAPIVICLFVIPLGLVAVFTEPGTSSIQPVFLTNDNYRTATDLASDVTTLEFQDSNQVILLLLYPENELAESFDVAIRDFSGRLMQQFEDHSRGNSGYVSIELLSSAINEGDYLLEIAPTNEVAESLNGKVESIPFRVTKNG
jgi:hypothetical protein